MGQGEVEPRALPSAADAVDEGERINAFWTVLIVNNYWVASHGSPSAMPCDVPVDTPWPLEMSEYTIARFIFNHYYDVDLPLASSDFFL